MLFFLGDLSSKILLVYDDEHVVCVHLLDELKHFLVLFIEILASVKHKYEYVSARYGLSGPLDTDLLDLVIGFAKACGIDKHDRHASQ